MFPELAKNVFHDHIWFSFEYGKVRVKYRSLGQILVKSCKHSSGHTFDQIFLKIAQNHGIDIWVKFKHGQMGSKGTSLCQILVKYC